MKPMLIVFPHFKKAVFIFVFFFIIPFVGKSNTIIPDSLLAELKNELVKKEVYINRKTARIDAIKTKLNNTKSNNYKEKYELYETLNIEYRSFKFDSAFHYAKELIKTSYLINDKSKIYKAKIQLGFVLISSGMFMETFDSLKTVDVKYLSDSLKIEYYSILARAYYDIGEYNQDNFYDPHYTHLGNLYIDSARTLSDKNSYNDLYFSGLKNLKSVHLDEAQADLSKLIEIGKLNHRQFAITASTLSFIHLVKGDTTRTIDLLVKAAISDIKTATRETSALTSLAELLYKMGNIKNAYEFILVSMEDAEFYGARQRKMRASTILQLIASAKVNNVEEQKERFFRLTIGLTILAIIIFVFILIILRQYRMLKRADKLIIETNKTLKEVNLKLREVNKIKEEYIGYYFNTHSEFLDKFEKFKDGLEKKLVDKKYNDLHFLINNINLKKEKESHYQNFDKVFLKLFPSFVKKFNSLFDKEDQFVLEEDELLKTELRIFALIRLGISDSNKIAKILGYSVNTIYAYKNRIKTKSLVSNEEFEIKIMDIRSV